MTVLDLTHIDLATAEDERVRMQCEAREDFYRRQRTQQSWVENLQQRLARAEEELESKDAEIARIRMLLEQGE